MIPWGLALVLMLTLPGLVTPDTGEPLDEREPHKPIVIRSDADLLLPEAISGNGVVGGTGTAADPFLIRGWRIDYADTYGITISDTTSHIIIQDVELMTSDPVPAEVGRVAFEGGLYLENVQNVRFERLILRDDPTASKLYDSDAVFEQAELHNSGLWAEGGRVTIRNSTLEPSPVHGALYCNACHAILTHTRIERSEPMQSRSGGPLKVPTFGLSSDGEARFDLEDVSIKNASFYTLRFGKAGSVTWRGGHAHNANLDFAGVQLVMEDVRITVEDISDEILHTGPMKLAHFGANASLRNVTMLLTQGRWGISQGDGHVFMDHVLIAGAAPAIILLHDASLTMRNSTVLSSEDSAIRESYGRKAGPLDLRYNYWGSPEGPVVGESKGYRAGVPASALVDPWLTESPFGPIDFEPARPRWLPGPGPFLVALALMGAALWRRRR